MQKQDLRTGMLIILRDESAWKVLLNTSKGDIAISSISSDSSWISLDDLDNNMTAIGEQSERFDIIKVYDTQHVNKYLQFNFIKYYNLVWEREEKEYYLKDNFLSGHDCYLNLGLGHLDEHFFLSSDVKETDYCKTKFTDEEIEELKIPIERFEKIEVEGD